MTKSHKNQFCDIYNAMAHKLRTQPVPDMREIIKTLVQLHDAYHSEIELMYNAFDRLHNRELRLHSLMIKLEKKCLHLEDSHIELQHWKQKERNKNAKP